MKGHEIKVDKWKKISGNYFERDEGLKCLDLIPDVLKITVAVYIT